MPPVSPRLYPGGSGRDRRADGATFIRQSWYPAEGEASSELCPPPTSLPHCASLLLSGMKQGWGSRRGEESVTVGT